MRAAAVIVGDEVLSGKVEDQNTPFLIAQLRAMGVRLVRLETVPDELDIVADAVARASGSAELVVTSGGVGPTHDDITMAAVAAAFGVPLQQHAELSALVQKYAGPGDSPLQRMAWVPEGTQLVYDDSLPWPLVQVHNVFVLPGVPRYFQAKFAVIRRRFSRQPPTCHSLYVLLREEQLVPHFEALLTAHPGVRVGSYPRTTQTEWQVRVTFEHDDPSRVDSAVADLSARLDPSSILRSERDA